MPRPVPWILIALLAKNIASRELTCNTTTTGKGTFYEVSDFGKAHCESQWIDADNHMLANSDGKNDSLVISYNITFLHTYHCYNTITYFLDCYPSKNKTVTCVANCSESAGLSETPTKEGTMNHWVIPVVVFILLVTISLAGIYYCRRQRRNQGGL